MSGVIPARGSLSGTVLGVLGGGPTPRIVVGDCSDEDALGGDDFHLALYLCYELHYRGLPGVDDTWEWSPELLGFRSRLEDRFESALRAAFPPRTGDDDALTALAELAEAPVPGRGPSLSEYMAGRGTLEQMRELCIHRSAYQLKEADPHTWAIPRLAGEAKAAMVEIQQDEYGNGERGAMHSSLFAETMEELGLDSTYGAYVDRIPGMTLATVNLVSMLGLHRRLLAAIVGHLALFEMTSVGPMSRYSSGLARLGASPRARRFYDVHVEADARHEQVALHRMVAGLLASEPGCGVEMVQGARWLTGLEARFSRRVMACWSEGACSLYR